MRPPDLPAADRFGHGTRARYVAGCRCGECKAANLAAYHARQSAMRAAAREAKPSGPAGQGFIVRAGVRHRVRTCPGANGAPCVRVPAAWLKGAHDVCSACVERATVWNGNVPAKSVRAHLRRLSKAGVGYKSVAAACDVAPSTLGRILNGTKKTVRATTEKRVLEIDGHAVADHALVDAGPTWKLIRRLLRDGSTEGEIAQRLGAKRPVLQLGKRRVLAKTALRVRRLYEATMAGA